MTSMWIDGDTDTPVVELRRYRLHPGRRDELIALFEAQFLEPHERVGARILGTFRVAGEPDQFLWLRGFADMAARQRALEDFYDGPVWAQHRDAANATMIDSDDVHLLRAVRPQGGLELKHLMRHPTRPYRLMISHLRHADEIGEYHLWMRLWLRKAGCDPLASFATLASENNFPRLPVWRDRTVHVALIADGAPLPRLPDELAARLRSAPEIIGLEPTDKSLLR